MFVNPDAATVEGEVVALEKVEEIIARPAAVLGEGKETNGEVVGFGEDPADAVR